MIYTDRKFPNTRLRRTRIKGFSRNLIRENRVHQSDLILPIFIVEGSQIEIPIPSMPDIKRYSKDKAIHLAEKACELGIPAIALFPAIESSKKDNKGTEALNPDGLVPKTIAYIKKRFPELGIISDIALDPYTDHGQDGLIDINGFILNDETNLALSMQAIVHAEAGSDIVAPSDMMDGRIAMIRQALEENKFPHVLLLSYAAKYASCFYGPFRDAVGSGLSLGKSSKTTYQMDPGNSNEALHEVALDLQEGADMLLVKPGITNLDILRLVKDHFSVPTFVYQVSGEYAMIKAAGAKGWIDEKSAVLEQMICFKRAGADAIFTYFAIEIAEWIKENSL